MSEPTLKPFTGKLDDNTDTNQQPALKPFTGALDGEKKGVMGHLKDTGLSALKGAIAVPELAVGIMDVMSDGATGKTLENKDGTVGFRPKEAKQALGDLHTDQYKAQQQEFADAGKDGNWVDKVVDKTKVALTNPSLIANTVVESVPSMLAGGVLGRASGIANPVVAGAVGEGAVMAGSQAEQIRQETVDGRLTADQSLASVGTGALGGLFGYAGGRLAQKMGLSDVDTAMQTGRLTTQQVGEEIAKTPMRAIPTAVIKGAISEGFLEELPQSVSEQILQNLALDKPWHDGVENAAVMGTLAGMAMGGTVSGVGKAGDWWNSRSDTGPQDNQQQSGSPNLPSAPSQLGSSPDSALTGEYIPRGNASQGDNQGRTAFVYDQPSMDADNLLNNNGFDYGGAANGNPTSPDTPPAPNGNYFDDDYGSEAAFDDLLNAVPPANQTPSQQMGINPNDGPMSSAAALAVDSGASPIAQLEYTPEQQTQEQSNTPISDAVPSNYQSLLGSQNDGQSFNANLEDATAQQGNTQADMGGAIETDTAQTTSAQTVQPILGQDGKNKWFGTQEKAQAFIDKKDLGNDYQVVQDGKRFEIQPKSQVAQTQNVDTLPKTESANQDDVPNPYNENKLRAQVRDLNLQARKEAQANNAEDSKYIANLGNTASARSNEKVKQQLPDLYKRAEELAKTAEITSAGRRGNTHFSSLSFKGDSSFVSGDPWPKRPTKDEVLQQAIWHLSQDENNGTPKNVQSALQLTELEKQFKNEKSVAKKAQLRKQITELQNGLTEQAQSTVSLNQPQKATVENLNGGFKKIEESTNPIKKMALKGISSQILSGNRSEVEDVIKSLGITEGEIASIQPDPKDNFLDTDFKYLPTADKVGVGSDKERAIFLPKTKGKKGQWQKIEDDYVLAMDGGRFVDLPKMTREQAIQLSNRDGENKYYDVVPRAYANHLEYKPVADIKNLADSTQETTPPNAAPNTEDLVSVTTTDGETHMVLASELNDSNVKNLTKFSAQGKRVAVKLPRGRIASTSEQSKQPQQNEAAKQGEATKTEATKTEATPKPKAEASENRLVSDDRAAELRARLKAKLSQLNSGIDPEIMAIGAELAVYHIERGARKFAALAKNIANDLDVSVEKIRPYLRSWYNGARDMMEDMGSDIQGMDSAETVRAELAKLDNSQQQSNAVEGKTETVVTPSGREFEVQHKVVEVDDLITSNLDSGAVNTEYPQALQPRDRTTLKSVTQINDIANKLNPKLLGDSASSTNGAPIVSSDNEVESGNGRTLAIRKAYQTGKADAYKAWLAEQGYDVANMQQPILVRERITPMNMAERVAYTTESNERDTLDMSPSEQAMSDAPKVMDILHLVQGGSFNNTANRDFVNAFLTGVASKNERGTMLDKDGVSLTQDGYRRIESALLAAAFNDAQIISQVIESKDSDIKAIGNALIEVAPQWAQVRKGVQDGILVEGVNVEANLVEAVHLVRKARQQNLSLSEMLNQDDIFDGSIDQVTKDFISIFYSGDKLNKARSSQKVADALKSYAQLAMTAKASPNLFGDAPLSNEQILGQVHEKLRQSEAEKQQDFFSSQGANDTNPGTVGGGRSGRGAIAGSETAQEQSEPTKALKKTAPTSEKETIQDFGEKIGGARKDTSVKTGPKTSGTTTKDNRPTWAKRFEITEIAASSNPNEVGKWIITDTRKKDWKGNAKQLGKQFFDSQKDAELALPILAVAQKHRVWAAGKDSFSIYREISDRKRVKVVEQEFQTREDAMKYMAIHAIEILETNTTFGEIDLPRPENTVRKGLDRRKGDAKDADFIRVFGFRGVEFGNWNNQAERQELLNDAFDGLMDLAEILNIPPAAISLNGELALAFGARGQGLSGAKAHYEPERAVINLTKLNGAGSLAHEWWHALDHYFGRQDGKAPSEWVTNADGSRSLKIAKHFEDMSVTSGFSYKSNVREDVQEAYKQLVQTIFRKSENYIEDTVKVESFVSSARNNLKDQLDKLRADLNRELDPKYYKRFNKAASAEQLAEFDTVAELLLTGTALTTEIRHNNNKNSRNIFSGARWSNDALDKLSVIYKSVRGRSGFNAEQKGVLDRLRQYMNTYAQRLKLLAEAQNGTEKAKMIPTDFAMNAKELDQGRGTDYWITTPEMTARAFQGYVEDKISQNSGYSPFLNFGPESAAIFTPWGFKRPFPTGTERKAINAKFSDLVDTLKTEETETGIKLYSRDKLKPDNERRGASPLDTTFTPLSVVSATHRVLSILEHLKIVTTQIDASVRGRIVVGWQRVGVNKVKGLDSHSFTVQVVESFDGLPSAIQEDNRYQGENGETKRYDVLGVWHNGSLYINAGDIQGNNSTQQTTFEMYEELILHEVVGHFGVQQIFGREYKTKLQQLFNALGGLEGIRKIAKDNGVDMQQFNDVYINPRMQAVKDEIYTESDVQQSLVGELFAFVAQNAKSRPFVRQKLKEVIGYIRQWFRDRGFDQFLSRYNDADLMMFLSEARKAVVDRSYFGKYKNQEFSSKNNSDTPLYSRRTKSNSGSTVQQVRSVLIDRFGKETIDELERQGKLEIIQDYQVEGVEGYYYNGKAVLVASNLTDQSVIPTFLHELGGHAGFQNMMNQKQYNELMNQFNKLVEQGNPVALAAKMLAEREQGSERQHLEYLPYLLTLSSTMQQRNVIQRNALQRLIQNIVTYVKAWVFDRFGVNLNLNPDDMLALSERMIEKFSYHSDAAINQHGVAKYSLNENSHAPFQKAIDRVMDGHTPQQFIKMGKTPDVLKMVGMPDAPITIHGRTIEKVMGEYLGIEQGNHSHLHNLTPETLRQLPQQINNPIAIFKSADTASKNGYIVLTELRETDTKSGKAKPVVVALHVKASNTGIEIVNVASVYGRSTAQLQRALDNDLLYWNKEKGQLFLKTVGLQLPLELQSDADLSNANIKTNEDLVKYQEQPLYSRSSNYDDITNRIANGFKNLPKTGDWINKKGVDWLKFGLQALSRRHLTEIYGKLLPPLNKYNELAAQMDADKNDIAAEADNIVREWSKLKDEEALANVMHDATLAQIDPAKPYQQGDNKVKYQQLLHAYNNLSPEAQAMYKKARNAYSGHYAKVREAIRERILRSALSSQKKADLLQKIEGSFGQIKGVYFPLARFGKYVVVLRNQNGEAEVVSRAETYSEAKSIRSELMLKYPQFKADDVEQDAEFNASRDSVGRGFMSDLFDEVGNLGLDAKAQAEFEDTLSQLYLSSMPDLSWAKHGIHRKGTAGFSNDARRAFAQHMFSGANYLGKLRYGDQLAQQLDEMKKYSKEQFNKGVGYDQRSARSVIDEMEKRHELLMNPKGNPLSSFLTSVGFMYYMGLSPAAAIVNLSQTALVAYPIMGAKWGFDKAGKELLKASSDFAKGVEFNVPDFSSLENFKNSIGDVYSPNIDKVIKGLELDAYNKAVSRGVIDVTQAHDLAGIAQGEDSKVMWYFRPAMRLASGMFHHAERFNREVTFIAAYRLATQAGANHDTAFEQAMDAVYKGHFDYSAGNRARFMQGPVAKVLLLFKQYAQNMIYTLVRNAHQSIYALDPKEQKEARRALAGILGMHALAAGAIGLPITGMLATASILIAKKSKLGAAAFGAAALAAFFGAADGDDEDPYELENVIRNWLADIHPTFADLVFGGVPRAFSPVDLSGRVGLNNLIIPDVQEGLEGADWATAMQSALLGPVVGISTSTVKGLQQIQEGDYWRGIETMLPIFLKNIRKSFRYADEGVLTKNKDVIHPEDVTGVELFSQAIGFSPASVRTSYEGRSAIFQYRTKLEDHRHELMRKWVVARQEDDSDGMNKVWTEILEFNAKTAEKNPKMRISRMNLMQSYKATERKAKETGDGGVYLTKRQKGAEEQGGFAFNR